MNIVEIYSKVFPILYSGEQASDNTAQTTLTPSLDQCQRASHGLKPHCVPVSSLLVQYITGGQDTAEE